VKFSIITPTHLKNSFLGDLYESLVAQTYENWEWVIYLNGVEGGLDALVNYPVLVAIKSDERIKIVVSDEINSKIGFNKNKAFHLGTGDVLVEVDHDDILTPDCLEELYKAFQDPTVGFVYSDSITYHVNNEFTPYDAHYGWTYKKVMWRGKEHYSMNSFAPTSHSMAYIWYAPDHVRAWRKSVYVSIGGHNVNLDVCDDHELVIRTYLNTKMHHINKPLYVYRITGNNTWLERNQAIQDTTRELFKQYAWDLACKDAKDRGLDIVELGGGINPRAGCNINIDLEDGNVTADLNNGIPLPDNSVGVINASHIIEHLNDKHKIMAEIYRVLADDGWVFIQVPSTDGRGAFQDPTHVSYWNENCFWYYTRKDKAMFIRNDKIRFQEFKLDTFWWEPRSDNIAITDAWLVAIKSDKRRPHPVKI
jgi:glycosyltransferase involved in cell wall biosynthesis